MPNALHEEPILLSQNFLILLQLLLRGLCGKEIGATPIYQALEL